MAHYFFDCVIDGKLEPDEVGVEISRRDAVIQAHDLAAVLLREEKSACRCRSVTVKVSQDKHKKVFEVSANMQVRFL